MRLNKKEDQTRKGLIIVSGGMDSVTMLYDFADRIALGVSFDYGAKHNAKEIPFAKEHCERLGIRHIVIPLSFMNQYFRSDLLQSGGEIPEGQYAEDNMASTVVPFRNGIMLSIAAGLAESYGLAEIYIANHFGDHSIYPDCRADFVLPMGEAIAHGTSNAVCLKAPYTGWYKIDIAKRGKTLGIDYRRTWSCYKGEMTPCRKCATCLERIEALRAIGEADFL
ncbi:7-cyano-7-deazaguanine synthase QueC [Porphyromonas crevioricanis]|uniref:7-cyano-7-deazaguanine synthase QueC n=1 Tax=Porphyromonas crevioricanis TaxID=393921 RepID=UPI001F1DAF29|nr:7-cyano-7-deazaguanine synthase QueC [Porphyromonas crevioricanis]